MGPCSENRTKSIKATTDNRFALNIHFNVFPRVSDKYPKMGPPTTPPTSSNDVIKPDINGEYPRDSLKNSGSHR